MKKIVFTHIHTWLLIFWAIVMATTIATFLFIYTEISDTMSSITLAQVPNSSAASNVVEGMPKPDHRLAALKLRIFLLLTGSVVFIGGVGFLWVRMTSRKLGRPVRILSGALSRLSRGKLNETVTLDTRNEFSQIATGINELAANLQELLLYIWKQSGQCLEKIECLEASTGSDGQHRLSAESVAHIEQLNKAVHDLREMAKAYVFYDVYLDGDKTLAANNSGNPSQEEESSK
jgi:methyl-accepting chemotaxis protein